MVAKIVQRWRKTRFLSDKDQRRLTCALQNMRMSCNSTYLLDQETDHGVKADELAALFDDLFAEPDAKAVVFSQWTRTHDIVIRRLEARGLGYVSFHGGVPSEKRPALVERFRDDPDCRVFLSTDAGSTGLNLQHASTLVNMDLPWNPAVLEQRIARIHRMGQTRPVQVINFVSKGTIEEGMLSVLAFKRSLVGRNSRRRQRRDFARRLAPQPLHEGRRERHRPHGRGRGRDAGGRGGECRERAGGGADRVGRRRRVCVGRRHGIRRPCSRTGSRCLGAAGSRRRSLDRAAAGRRAAGLRPARGGRCRRSAASLARA